MFVSFGEDDEQDVVSSQSCHFLQTGLGFRKHYPFEREDAEANITVDKEKGICLGHLSQQDLSTPIAELSEAYGEDGWCVYGALGGWIRECAVSRRTHNLSNFLDLFWTGYVYFLNGPQATPYTLTLFDNRTLTIRDHSFPLDDLYCFVNGWYSLDRAAIVGNFSYLEEASEKACKHLEETVPGYFNISFNDFARESDADELLLETLAREGGGFISEDVVKGMRLHAATKCLFRGGGRGAVCDLANCAERGRLGPNNEVLYTVRGECESVWADRPALVGSR
ncbi:Uncharacterized protein SCF082_LOCUS32917 [Durusdinium trenchii]|uniref:Uncharacterized protein n=1 Tax=Durusdinium trenchii TaxID=1381693 RepID=A0ABP0NLA3_9DINO